MEFDKKRIGYCRNLARSVLKRYEKQQGTIKPPIPVIDIAEWTGFKIESDDSMDDVYSALLLVDYKIIQVNSNHHIHRQRFSIGHELGHFYLDHPSEEDCEREEIELFDKEADEFSSELLIPLNLLKNALRENKDITTLSRLFKVSPASMTIKIASQRKLYDL